MNYIKLFLLTFLVLQFSFAQQKTDNSNFDSILKDMELNSVFLLESGEMEENEYFKRFGIDLEEHKILLKRYYDNIELFLAQDKSILCYLSGYKKNEEFSFWIKTIHPYRSNVYGLLLSKSESALILIDFYLNNEGKRVVVPDYYEKLDFRKMKKFLKKNKTLNVEELRDKYKKSKIWD